MAWHEVLIEFCRERSASPFSWPDDNCGLVLADYAMALGHRDPAPQLRGLCLDETDAQRTVLHFGGMVALVASLAQAIGAPRVDAPGERVVAVIGAAGRAARQWGAIWDGERWLVRDLTGFRAYTARPLAMWKL